MGIPSWDTDGLYIYGPTASSSEVAAKYTAARWELYTAGTERIRIDSSGNVGIGTASPAKTLDVNGQLRIRNGGATGYGLLEYGASSTATNNWHVGSEGDGSFRFYNGNFGAGTERIRIDSSGRVGIGRTPTTNLLEVAGTIESTTGGFKFPDGSTQTSAGVSTGKAIAMAIVFG
jgi:hypothetical protein